MSASQPTLPGLIRLRSSPSASARQLAWIVLIVLSVVVPLVFYLFAAGAGFLYDDARMVLLNAGPPAHLARAFVELRDVFYRPIFELVIGLEGDLFWSSAFPYHVVNLAI